MLLCLSSLSGDVYTACFAMVGKRCRRGLLGYGQDRVGPRGQALSRSRPAGQAWVPGAADGSIQGQHVGCGSRLAGQAAPGVWGASRAGGVDLAGGVALEAADDLR